MSSHNKWRSGLRYEPPEIAAAPLGPDARQPRGGRTGTSRLQRSAERMERCRPALATPPPDSWPSPGAAGEWSTTATCRARTAPPRHRGQAAGSAHEETGGGESGHVPTTSRDSPASGSSGGSTFSPNAPSGRERISVPTLRERALLPEVPRVVQPLANKPETLSQGLDGLVPVDVDAPRRPAPLGK